MQYSVAQREKPFVCRTLMIITCIVAPPFRHFTAHRDEQQSHVAAQHGPRTLHGQAGIRAHNPLGRAAPALHLTLPWRQLQRATHYIFLLQLAHPRARTHSARTHALTHGCARDGAVLRVCSECGFRACRTRQWRRRQCDSFGTWCVNYSLI